MDRGKTNFGRSARIRFKFTVSRYTVPVPGTGTYWGIYHKKEYRNFLTGTVPGSDRAAIVSCQ